MQKKKKNKIRRYGNIYGRGMGSGSWQIILAMIVGILLFGLVGWSLYTPIHNWFVRQGQEQPIETSSVAPLSSAPTQEESSSTPAAVSVPEVPAPPVQNSAMSGIYLPVAALADRSVLSGFLDRAAAAALDTVVLEAKDATGRVLYTSKNEIARQLGAADLTAYDPSELVKEIKGRGFVPAARLHAFRDAAAATLERDMAVRYYDTDSLWFDNDPALGGKPWLNPCSPVAQQYVTELALELVGQGFEVILLDSVQFPSGLSLGKASYGVVSPDRSGVLSGFIDALRIQVEAAGARLVVCLPGDVLSTGDEKVDVLTQENNRMVYGGSPAAWMTGSVMITLSNHAAVSKMMLERARAEGPSTQWYGLLPAYHDDGSLIKSSALLEGIDPVGYLLYNPQGNYQLHS